MVILNRRDAESPDIFYYDLVNVGVSPTRTSAQNMRDDETRNVPMLISLY